MACMHLSTNNMDRWYRRQSTVGIRRRLPWCMRLAILRLRSGRVLQGSDSVRPLTRIDRAFYWRLARIVGQRCPDATSSDRGVVGKS